MGLETHFAVTSLIMSVNTLCEPPHPILRSYSAILPTYSYNHGDCFIVTLLHTYIHTHTSAQEPHTQIRNEPPKPVHAHDNMTNSLTKSKIEVAPKYVFDLIKYLWTPECVPDNCNLEDNSQLLSQQLTLTVAHNGRNTLTAAHTECCSQ